MDSMLQSWLDSQDDAERARQFDEDLDALFALLLRCFDCQNPRRTNRPIRLAGPICNRSSFQELSLS